MGRRPLAGRGDCLTGMPWCEPARNVREARGSRSGATARTENKQTVR